MARILVMKNNRLLEEVPITGDKTQIGRDQVNHVRLVCATTSRYHAEIHRRGLCYTLIDKQSTNGTRLNGEYLAEKQVLNNQDQIVIGEFTLIFSLDDTDRPRQLKPGLIDSSDTVYDLQELA